MTSLLGKIFGSEQSAPRAPMRGDIAYAEAMSQSDELIRKMQDASNSNDPVRAVMADLFLQRHNVPFMVTIVETVEEMTSGIKQKPTDR
jgi:hypothetical protein